MLKETTEQKENRIFNFYKKDLKKLDTINQIRFNVIQYTCSFPKINPFKMAAVLMSEGHNIVFDDSSITVQENKKLEKQVMSYMRRPKA